LEPRAETAADERRRQELEKQGDRYIAELIAEVGQPSGAETGRADAIARRLQERALAAQTGRCSFSTREA
jgi:hypothetical protein